MAGNANSGRNRLPISEHLEAGSYRADRHGAIPDTAAGVPTMPRDLDANGRACWKANVADLVSRGMAKQIDTFALRQMCEMWSLYRAALKLANKSPTDGEIRAAVCGYFAAFQAIAKKFGLAFGDRQKLRVVPKETAGKVASRTRA